jgi:hypothetical protein
MTSPVPQYSSEFPEGAERTDAPARLEHLVKSEKSNTDDKVSSVDGSSEEGTPNMSRRLRP